MTPRAPGYFADLRTRLVGGSLLRRTVVTVAAFTMTTVLLLGLLSAAAIGATRAVAGAPADDPTIEVVADEAGDDEATGDPPKGAAGAARSGKSAKSTRSTKGEKSGSKSEPRRAGGAVSPGEALKRSGKAAATDEEEP